VSPSSDVFALANVLFEIAARRLPFGELEDPADVVRAIAAGQRPAFPTDPLAAHARGDEVKGAAGGRGDGRGAGSRGGRRGGGGIPWSKAEKASRQRFEKLVGRSWATAPEDRPTAAEIAEELNAMRAEYYRESMNLCGI
jgi:hypothetical protein